LALCGLAAATLCAARVARAEPEVPGFVVEVYATVPGPVGLSFDSEGNLLAGRDEAGSSGREARKIHRIAPGGTVAEFGPESVPDPDGVFVDVDGSVSGSAGAVLICGEATPGDGQIVALLPEALPDESVLSLHPPSGVLSNPNYMARGRDGLLISDAGRDAIFSFVFPGTPSVLIESPANPAYLAVDAAGRIYVSHVDGVVRQYDADGAPLNEALLSGLGGAAPLAVSPGGPFGSDLYVLSGASGELLRVAEDGSASVVGTGFPGSLGEIEFGPDGALYVASFAAGEVLRIAPLLPVQDLDAFLCYGAHNAKDTEPFEPRAAELSGSFENGTARVSSPKTLCSPATAEALSERGATIGDPATFLDGYQLGRRDRGQPHAPQRVALTNAFGDFSLDTLPRGADRLLVPSALGLSEPPGPLAGAAVDAFRCYRARLPRGERFERRMLGVASPLSTTRRVFDVRAPRRLCLPVELDGAAIQRPENALVCYAARPAKGESRSTIRTGMHLENVFGPGQRLDMARGRTPARSSVEHGRISGDSNETFAGGDAARPGTWTELEGEPRWSGGGPLGEGDWLRSSFTDAVDYPEGEVTRWRVFVEIDVFVNDTREGPGVVMHSHGIPGIPDDTVLRAMGSGKPRGLRVSSPYFTPPAGTTLDSLAGAASQEFEPDGDSSTDPFAFQLKRWGIEYELVRRSGGAGTGVPERELCLPSELSE
jgi:hypothetical protein